MTAKRKLPSKTTPPIFERVREILESARANVACTVNSTQVVANWLIGREIVEEEQQGKKRAGYGETLLADLAHRLSQEFGKGWSLRQLEYCRSFYASYPMLIAIDKTNAVRSLLANSLVRNDGQITNAVRRNLMRYAISGTAPRKSTSQPAAGDASVVSWQPGILNPGLSWSHYRRLLRVATIKERSMVVPKATP